MSSEAYVAHLSAERRSIRPPKHTPELRARIRRVRAEDGLTKLELSERFGLHPTTISRILRGDWE